MRLSSWATIGIVAFTLWSMVEMAEALEAGAAMRVVTPQKPVYLAGLGHPRLSDGVHDDLYARALALRDGETSVILVGVDVIGLSRLYVVEMKTRLAERGVPSENLLVCSTHQHSGPDTIGLWGPDEGTSGVDPGYLAFLKGEIVAVAAEAYGSLRPANVAQGAKRAPAGIVRNARVPGYWDDELRVLHFTDADGKTIGTLVNFACHPETLWSDSHKLTADYPSYVYRLVEKEFGGTTVFINGALGGMVTPDSKGHTWEELERIGTAVAETALGAIRGAKPLENPSLTIRRSVFSYPMENDDFKLAIQAGVIPLKLDGDTSETEVNLIRVGDAVIATVPGELLPKLGFQLREAMQKTLGVSSPFILGLANDELGYIIAEDEFDAPLYKYEKSMSVGKRIGTQVVEELRGLMEKSN